MPEQVNREEARMLVAAIGYEEASKKTGIKAATLRQWSKRFQWKTPVVHSRSKAVTCVTKPSQALQDVLSERSHKTKLHMSKAVLRASKAFAGLPGESLIHDKVAGSARSWTSVADTVHGWQGEKDESKGLFGGLRIYAQQAVIGIDTKQTTDT